MPELAWNSVLDILSNYIKLNPKAEFLRQFFQLWYLGSDIAVRKYKIIFKKIDWLLCFCKKKFFILKAFLINSNF